MTTPIAPTSAAGEYDVVVVGSGAGGLSAAVTAAHHGLQVTVLERAEVCGGATAWSGGWMWAPGNPLTRAGLFAVGSDDQASVMGGHCPASGINIGPAMTSGWIAARDLAGAGAELGSAA